MVMKTKDKIGMLVINGCFAVVLIFINTFFISHIWYETGEDFISVALFTIIMALSTVVFWGLNSILITNFLKPIWGLRIASVVSFLFLAALGIWQDVFLDLYLVFAIVWGIIIAVYWSSMNYIVSTRTAAELKGFVIWKGIVQTIIGLVVPLTLGIIIDVSSIYATAIVALCLAIVWMVASTIITTETPEGKRFRIITCLKKKRENNFVRPGISLWFVIALSGFIQAIMLTLPIVTIIAFGNNTGLGMVASIASGVVILTLFIYRRISKKIQRRTALFVGILPVLAAASFIFSLSTVTVTTFFLTYYITFRIASIEEQSVRLGATKYWGGKEFTMESNYIYELALIFGRIISIVVLIVTTVLFDLTPLSLGILYIVMMAGLFTHMVLLQLWKKKHAGRLEQYAPSPKSPQSNL